MCKNYRFMFKIFKTIIYLKFRYIFFVTIGFLKIFFKCVIKLNLSLNNCTKLGYCFENSLISDFY